MQSPECGEFAMIERLGRRLARRSGVQLGIGDDAALLDPLQAPAITCDCLIEKVHFRREWISSRQLGWKSLAVNISDLAAMAATPVAAFVTLALGPHDDLAFVEELYQGLENAASEYGVTIAGGDCARSACDLMIAITACGNAPLPVTRAGARPGHVLLVTGSLGAAAGGLWLLSHPAPALPPGLTAHLLRSQLEPRARLAEMHAARTVAGAVQAAIDISDGIAGDAAHIARQSGVTVQLDAHRLPVDEATLTAARLAGLDPLTWALSGGEDYELLLAVEPGLAAAVAAAITHATGTAVTEVGRCEAAGPQPVVVVQRDGSRQPAPAGYTHF